MCIYTAIRELGPRYLKHEVCWVPIGVLRSTVMKKVPGGFSTCLRMLLRQWMLEHRILDKGVLLDLGLSDFRYAVFHFKLGNILADGDAYRAAWSAKGASGNVPCLLCKNVVALGNVRSDFLVHFSCPDASRFDSASNEDIWAKADLVKASRGVGTKAAFERLQMVHGLTDSPSGLLWDLELRSTVKPVDVITFDAMHITVGNGMCQNEVGWLFSVLKEHMITWRMVSDFCKAIDWKFCKSLGTRAKANGCFAHAREEAWRSGGVFKSSASEMLLVIPLLMLFCDKVVRPRGICLPQLASLEALLLVLGLIRRGKAGELVHDELAATIRLHACRCLAAYSQDDMKPKNHYMQHLPGQLLRDGLILDAFVGERKNGAIKKLAGDIDNTKRFEKSAILNVFGQQICSLEDQHIFEDKLERPVPFEELAAVNHARSALLARCIVIGGTRLWTDDAVVIDKKVHVVTAGCEIDGKLFLITRCSECLGDVTSISSRWRVTTEASLADFCGQTPQMVEAWYYDTDGTLVALVTIR